MALTLENILIKLSAWKLLNRNLAETKTENLFLPPCKKVFVFPLPVCSYTLWEENCKKVHFDLKGGKTNRNSTYEPMQRFCVARRGFWKEWPISWLAEFSWRRHKNQWTNTFYLLSIFFVPARNSKRILVIAVVAADKSNEGGTMGPHNEGPAQSNPITLSFSKNLFVFKALKGLLTAASAPHYCRLCFRSLGSLWCPRILHLIYMIVKKEVS